MNRLTVQAVGSYLFNVFDQEFWQTHGLREGTHSLFGLIEVGMRVVSVVEERPPDTNIERRYVGHRRVIGVASGRELSSQVSMPVPTE